VPFVVIPFGQTKSPLSFALQRASNLSVCCSSSAPHPRRRAVRVMMVVVMVLQHE
jgi:hypothetical protein